MSIGWRNLFKDDNLQLLDREARFHQERQEGLSKKYKIKEYNSSDLSAFTDVPSSSLLMHRLVECRETQPAYQGDPWQTDKFIDALASVLDVQPGHIIMQCSLYSRYSLEGDNLPLFANTSTNIGSYICWITKSDPPLTRAPSLHFGRVNQILRFQSFDSKKSNAVFHTRLLVDFLSSKTRTATHVFPGLYSDDRPISQHVRTLRFNSQLAFLHQRLVNPEAVLYQFTVMPCLKDGTTLAQWQDSSCFLRDLWMIQPLVQNDRGMYRYMCWSLSFSFCFATL
jgi:hypothetical protein